MNPPDETEELFDVEDYGDCPNCGSPLINIGAMSTGDGDLFDELICPMCDILDDIQRFYWSDGEQNE